MRGAVDDVLVAGIGAQEGREGGGERGQIGFADALNAAHELVEAERARKDIFDAELASAALKMMEDHRITSLFVANEAGRLEGVVHIHDLWGLELF